MTTIESADQFDIDSYDRICQVVNLAMKGAAEGSVTKLREAFHEEARMFGEGQGQRYDEPISSFFELCQNHPLANEGNYRSRIVSVTRVGGAAMVMVAE